MLLEGNCEILIHDNNGILICYVLFVLGFNDTSTLVGHFLSSPRGREKRDRRGDEREGHGRKRKMNESEETRNKNIPPLPLPAAKIAGFAQL